MSVIGRALLWTSVLLVVLGASARVRAQSQPFRRNDYAIDLLTTPVVAAGRIVGMGGAHTAIASGIDGAPYNPAGYAERYEKEIDWFAFDVTGGLQLSNLFTRNDFDNNGVSSSATGSAVQVLLGLRLQFSYFGTGLNWQARRYELNDDVGRKYVVTLQTFRTGSGYSFLNGGLVGGFTVSVYKFGIATPGGADLANFQGYGGEVGMLLRPAGERYRVGFAARTPVSATLRNAVMTSPDGVDRAQGLVLPYEIHVPWEVSLGFAYQFGERRTNTPWRNTNRLRNELRNQIAAGTYQLPETFGERPYQQLPRDPEKALDVAMANYREGERRFRRHQPRRYVLLSADVIAWGATKRGHGLDAFLNQTPERSGRKISYGARVGVESEIWPDRMKVRAGSYLEPSRFKGSLYRAHGTAGFDVRLFDLWRWSIRGTATVDLAPRYFNWGIAFGLWW